VLHWFGVTKRKRKNAPDAGRPPSGAKGEKSSTYPKIRIEPSSLAGLQALAEERGVAVWQVATEAARDLLRKTGWSNPCPKCGAELALNHAKRFDAKRALVCVNAECEVSPRHKAKKKRP